VTHRAMSEIKFICPHCSQHIACDEIYCGEEIICPGCAKKLFVPERSVFVPLHGGNLTLAVPVARKEPPSTSIGQGALSENEWHEHASQTEGASAARLLPLWILLVLPFILALISMTHRGGMAFIQYLFIVCSVCVGFYLALIRKKTGADFVLMGILYSIAAFVSYIIVGVSLLFVGCLVVLSAHK